MPRALYRALPAEPTGQRAVKPAPAFSPLLRKVFIVVPLTLLLPGMWGLGVDGVFLAEPISNFVGGLACFLTMYFTVYRRMKKEELLHKGQS